LDGLDGTLCVGTWVRMGDVTCVTCVMLEGQRHQTKSGLTFWCLNGTLLLENGACAAGFRRLGHVTFHFRVIVG